MIHCIAQAPPSLWRFKLRASGSHLTGPRAESTEVQMTALGLLQLRITRRDYTWLARARPSSMAAGFSVILSRREEAPGRRGRDGDNGIRACPACPAAPRMPRTLTGSACTACQTRRWRRRRPTEGPASSARLRAGRRGVARSRRSGGLALRLGPSETQAPSPSRRLGCQ